jgi:hypothetical protein
MNEEQKTKTPKEEAHERLLAILPHFRVMFEEAEIENKDHGGGTVEFGALALSTDGTKGRLVARFEPKGFLEDLALVLGEDTAGIEKAKLDARAAQIVHLFSQAAKAEPET